MARGGARQGKPGQSYSNRSDLGVAKLPAVAAPGQTYGVAGQQMAAQQAVPMGAQPTPTAPGGPPSAAGGQAGPPPPAPGSLTSLTAPSQRPDEPLTAGAPFGAGPGPAPTPDPMLSTIAALNSLGDKLDPSLRAAVQMLQANLSNGMRG